MLGDINKIIKKFYDDSDEFIANQKRKSKDKIDIINTTCECCSEPKGCIEYNQLYLCEECLGEFWSKINEYYAQQPK